MSINRAQIMGHLGQDPEIRHTQAGMPVASFSLATSEKWTDKQSGEKKEKTEWHRVTVWQEGLVKVVQEYLKKGSHVYIEGKIQTRKWTDENGVDRYSTEIVLNGYDSKLVMLGKANGSVKPAESPDEYGAEPARELGDEMPF